ncbi:hemerythrin domain-containing protein [Paractinoplanes atraurantiacus]|uniref:Hemerythrin HHE cation binding domain-containing protein n=1 Tax=Paractinoplanes atraurantiacus TaxID=1036182 RepID=A0A285IG12_9ACTN|nr:hemerythrin domain-containing protein [Actinoplanes atraurantiacus]SNY46908.1 Hemerythrin HHE cation binding domain-containing protein [Actinoplanes atraurantiacus]
MTTTDNPLLRELQQVHDMLRRDLARCTDSALSSAQLRDEVKRLDCLRYCRLVHSHHGGEDVALFPAVRRSAPHLSDVVDQLEADHQLIAGLLDEVEAAARRTGEVEASAWADDADARGRLAEALRELSGHLHGHLDREEEALAPVLLSWQEWPR